MARGGCPALSTELLLLLQPLSVLTFHLDLLFEHHHHLPLGPPPAAEAPGSPPALQQTVHAVLHWGGRLAQSLRGASGETPPGPRAPASAPTSGSWWEQLTQASRVYASGGSEGFPLPRWRSWRPGPAAGGPQARPVPTEDAAPGRGLWLGRLFGVPGSLAETDGGPVKSRYWGGGPLRAWVSPWPAGSSAGVGFPLPAQPSKPRAFLRTARDLRSGPPGV